MEQQEQAKRQSINKRFLPVTIYGYISIIGVLFFTYGVIQPWDFANFSRVYLKYVMLGYCLSVTLTSIWFILIKRKKKEPVAVSLLKWQMYIIALSSLLFQMPFYKSTNEVYCIFLPLINIGFCCLGVLITFITVITCKNLKPDKKKIRYYVLLFFLSFFAYFYDFILNVQSINFIPFSLMFFTLVCEFAFYKQCFPAKINEYCINAHNPESMKNAVKNAEINKTSLLLFYLGCFFLVLERIIDLVAGSKSSSALERDTLAIGLSIVLFFVGAFFSYCRKKYNSGIKSEIVDECVLSETAESEQEKNTETEITEEENAPFKNYKKEKDISFSQILDDFKSYAERCGIMIEDESIRRLFSAMAATRVILACSDDSENVKKLIQALSYYFGNERLYRENERSEWKNNFLYEVDSDSGSESNRLSVAAEGIRNATLKKSTLSFVEIDNASIENISNYFYCVAKSISNGTRRGEKGRGDETISAPENLYFVFNLKDKNSFAKLGGGVLSRISGVVSIGEVKGSLNAAAANTESAISYDKFKMMSESASEEYFAAEAQWRNIDSASRFVIDDTDFRLKNKTDIAIEKYIATYLAFKGTEKDAIDNALASILITQATAVNSAAKDAIDNAIASIFAAHATDNKKNRIEDLRNLLDKLFGANNLPVTQELLSCCQKVNADSAEISGEAL